MSARSGLIPRKFSESGGGGSGGGPGFPYSSARVPRVSLCCIIPRGRRALNSSLVERDEANPGPRPRVLSWRARERERRRLSCGKYGGMGMGDLINLEAAGESCFSGGYYGFCGWR